MKKDIILAGVGGQGILTVAAVIGLAAMEEGYNIKQSEVHGMSQRGGAVISHLRISSDRIFSDLIPEGSADIILGIEPMEAVRYLSFLKPEGRLITNSKPFVNIEDYPEHEKLLKYIDSLPRSIIIDADDIAKRIKAPKSSNVVMVGASSPFLGIKMQSLEKAVKMLFAKKGDKIISANIEALKAGADAVTDKV